MQPTLTNAEGELVQPGDDGWITTTVQVTIDEIIDWSHEDFLDALSERAGAPLLMAQEYTVVGLAGPNCLVFSVSGDASLDIKCLLDESAPADDPSDDNIAIDEQTGED